MCGISGIINLESFNHSSDKKIRTMIKTLKHRGPDDTGFFSDKRASLGFARLSIIDLSKKGHQPMTNEDETIWIIFNGEIFNYQSIREKLDKKHKFKSKTDTEVIIHGYEQWGEKILDKLEGMFGLAIYDKKNDKIIIARDRIGKKPLFYYKNKEQLIFSSEFRSIIKIIPKQDIKLDETTLKLWNGFPYLADNENTLEKNIKKIPPGHYLIYEKKDIKLKKYWDLKVNKRINNLSLNDATNELEKLLEESVANRLIADVPVGILLSGGLDSSLISALAKKRKDNITTLTASFDDVIDESSYAKIVSDHLKTKQLFLKVSPGNVSRDIEKLIWMFDDLSTCDGGLITTYFLAQEIRKTGIKVALVGEGSDEIFAGYSWFGLGVKPLSILPDTIKNMAYYWIIMRSLKPKFYFDYAKILKKHMNEQKDLTYLQKINYNEIKYSLPNHYCMKVDKGTSAASIEARTPYLDYKVVEFAYSLPDKYKLAGNYFDRKKTNEKFILRKIADKYLPREISQRKKKGGMLPIDKILLDGNEKIKEYLLARDGIALKLFSKKELENVLRPKKFILTRWEREWIIWRLFMLSVWYKKTFKGL